MDGEDKQVFFFNLKKKISKDLSVRPLRWDNRWPGLLQALGLEPRVDNVHEPTMRVIRGGGSGRKGDKI